MKKKSILVSLVVAILAAMTFVGCSDSVVYPKTVTDAKITQIGDFLTGQNFDSNKFEVEVTYLDGSSSKTVGSVSLDSTSAGIVTKNSYVTYTATDIKGNDIYRELSVSVYDINDIEITEGPAYSFVVGSESLDVGEDTDYVISASYYAGTELRSIPLSSSDYEVEFDAWAAGSAPTEEAESVDATIKITTSVGSDTTAEFIKPIQVSVTKNPAAKVVGIKNVAVNANVIAGYDYEVLPEIDPSDIAVIVKYDNNTDSDWINASTVDGIEFAFVNQTTHAALRPSEYNFKTNSNVGISATFGDATVYTETPIDFDEPVITVSYEGTPLVDGTALPALVPSDYYVLEEVNGKYTELTLDADAFMYTTDGANEYKGETVPASDGLFVVVEYQGITGSSAYINVDDTVPSQLASVSAVASNAAGPGRQYYNNITGILVPNATLQLASVTTTTNKGVSNTYTPADSDFSNVSVKYSLSNTELVELKNADDLVGVETIYLQVVWAGAEDKACYVAIPTTEASVDRLTVEVEYANAAADGTPMYGTEYTYTVYTANEYGKVEALSASEYTIDGVLPETVTEAESVTINAFVNDKKVTGTLAVDDPMAYVEFNSINDLKIVIAEGQEESVAPYLINDKMEWHFNDTSAAKYVVEGYTSHGDASIEINATNAFAYLTESINKGSNTVYAYISYVDAEGVEHENVRISYTFTAVPYVTVNGSIGIVGPEGKISSTKLLNGNVYNFSDFSVDEKSYTPTGDATLAIASIVYGGVTYESGDTITLVSTESGTITFNITPYMGSNGKMVNDAKVDLTVASSLD